jgi:hypothetical protein
LFLFEGMSLRFSFLFVGTNLKKHALVNKYPCVRASDGFCVYTLCLCNTPFRSARHACLKISWCQLRGGKRKSRRDWKKLAAMQSWVQDRTACHPNINTSCCARSTNTQHTSESCVWSPNHPAYKMRRREDSKISAERYYFLSCTQHTHRT